MSVEAAEVKRSSFGVVIAVGAALVIAALLFANLWTGWLWFQNLKMETVFTTQLVVRVGLFLVFGLAMAVIVAGNMLLAFKLRPDDENDAENSAAFMQFKEMVQIKFSRLTLFVAAGLGLLAGVSALSKTEIFLAWLYATPFGKKDPYFGLDVSFFVFSYPWWRSFVSFLLVAVGASAIASLVVHLANGAISIMSLRQQRKIKYLKSHLHLSILLGILFIIYGFSVLLDRYGVSVTDSGLFTGVHYTEATTKIPALLILAIISFISAGLFFANIVVRKWIIPVVSIILMVISGLILGVIYPAAIQAFEVEPNYQDKEAKYISTNITATRAGFGLENFEIEDYKAVATVSAGQLRADAEALPAIRLIDPAVIAPTFEQLQQVRGYYAFPKRLNVDRYETENGSTDAVVAARELDINGISETNWNNIHTVYTHGYGLVAAYGNKREQNGEPKFLVGGIPTVGKLAEHEPRIYYGRKGQHYVLAGAPEGSAPVELDTPGGGEDRTETKYTYKGKGGVPVGNFFNRLLYSIKFADINLLLTDRVNSESRILYNRTPLERVNEVAPWLITDSKVFPSVVDGRIVWIVDGYTTSSTYPNSTAVNWIAAVSDARKTSRQMQSYRVNYVRNSVKATVDAYDGTVKLYAWDEKDPILKTWQKVYPGTVLPKKEISADLLKHLRYPEDLLKVQREVLGRYHTNNSATWFQRSDVWQVPADPKEESQKEPPYFLTIKWPGDKKPIYSQTSVFVPLNRQNLSVYLAVNSDAASEDYGRMRILKLSDSQQIAGPAQTFNAISTDDKVAERLLPFTKQGNTKTIYGNLLTLPVGGGLLYVQPIYTQIQEVEGAYPALRFVAVRFGEHVGIGATLQQALDQVFGGDSGADTGENPIVGEPTPTPQPTASTQPGNTAETPVPQATQTPNSGTSGESAKELLAEAEKLFNEADEALKNGDLATYQQKLSLAKEKVLAAMRALN